MNSVVLTLLTALIITATCLFLIIFSVIRLAYGKSPDDNKAAVMIFFLVLLSGVFGIWSYLYTTSPWEIECEHVIQVQTVKDHNGVAYPVIVVEGKPVDLFDTNLRGCVSDGEKIKVTIYKRGPYYGVYKDVTDPKSRQEMTKFERIK